MSKVVHQSKVLSLVLRHKPETIGLKLDRNGWASIKELLARMNECGHSINREELDVVVEENNKKRFRIEGDKIRASQGHSIDVDLQMEAKEPPYMLYHGTATRFLDSIMKDGLISKKRQHVHLSNDEDTARSVGSRHGKVIVLLIDAKKMYRDGKKFYLSDNGVWLTDKVERKYIETII